MYLTRITRPMMARRQPNYWQQTEEFFRPFVEMMNAPIRTNVRETEEAYEFEAELPGYEAGEIELSLQDGVMTIAAEHSEEGTEGEERTASRRIRRSFTVEGVDEEHITAAYKNGMLRVTLPKEKAPEQAEPRKITISA